MLVLRRRNRESVVIGEQVTLTVEGICRNDDGRRIFDATVLLGFETPNHVSIFRSELLRTRGTGGTFKGKAKQPVRQKPGRRVEISDAEARLRIQVPRKIPVCYNGSPSVGLDVEEKLDGAVRAATVHRISCQKEDRITICHNISIAICNFHRFVLLGYPDKVSSQDRSPSSPLVDEGKGQLVR